MEHECNSKTVYEEFQRMTPMHHCDICDRLCWYEDLRFNQLDKLYWCADCIKEKCIDIYEEEDQEEACVNGSFWDDGHGQM